MAVVGQGCDSAQKLAEGKVAGSISASFQIQDVEPMAGKPGDRVVMRGAGLNDGLRLSMDGVEISDLRFNAAGDAVEFTVPAGTSGMKKIQVDKNGDRNTTAFLVQEPAGEAEEGEAPAAKQAEAASAVPVCTADGQIGCVTTERFRAADVQSVSDQDLLAGKVLGGVRGSYFPDFPEAGNVLVGDSSDGKPGKLTLPDAAKVLVGSPAYGNPGAPVTPTMLTADLPDVQNVLSSDTVGGTPGTLTLPDSRYVLDAAPAFGVGGNTSTGMATLPATTHVLASAGNWGIHGTGSTGSATLPAANTVLTGSPDFGVGGNASVPSYSPDFPDAQNVLNSDTVNFSAGTLTLPLTTHVLSTAGAYGVGGSGSTGTATLPPAGNVLSTSGAYGVGGSGSTPTLTLPLAGNVLAGSGSYGMSGTGSSPSLTLPPASHVLSSAGAFGVSGTGSTPTLTLPAAGNVLSTSGAFGVGGTGSTPTLTLPAADKVLYTASDYGVAGNSHDPSYTPQFPSAANVRTIDATNGIAGLLQDCSIDGAQGCVTTSSFKAANMFVAQSNNIAATATIAGVTGNLVPDGNPAAFIVQPAGNDDGGAPGGYFSIAFKSFPASGDLGTMALYYSTTSTLGCSGNPLLTGNGWTLIANNLNPDSFSYYWTTPAAVGNYNICAKFTNSAGSAYQVSSSPYVIGPCKSVSLDWLIFNGACLQVSTSLYWSYPTNNYMNHADATSYCAGLNQGGFGGWRLPTRAEYLALIASGSVNNPQHPPSYYWTATDGGDSSQAYIYSAYVSPSANITVPKTYTYRASCVR